MLYLFHGRLVGGYRLLVADAADDGFVGLESVDDVNEQADDGQGDEGEADDDVPLCPLEGRSEFWLYGIDAVGVEGVDVEGDDLEGERFGSVGLAVHLDFQFGYEYESRVEGREIVAATEQHALVVVEGTGVGLFGSDKFESWSHLLQGVPLWQDDIFAAVGTHLEGHAYALSDEDGS